MIPVGFLVDPSGGVPVVNPCDPQPEMLITVSGHSSDVTWMGETWTPAQALEWRSLCPNVGYAQFNYNADWHASFSAGTQWTLIRLFRGVSYFPYGYYGPLGANVIKLGVPGGFYYTGFARQTYAEPTFGTIPSTLVYPSDFKIFDGFNTAATNFLPLPTPLDYLIADQMFGNYTVNNPVLPTNGITFYWSKGAGWPS